MSETEELARLAVGGRATRRRRLSRALLARLIGERYEPEDEEFAGEAGEGEEEGRRIVRLLIGSRLLRRRRLRNLLLAHLLQERGEAEEDDDEEASGEEEDSDKERRIVRLLIGSRLLRRRRLRNLLLAHLLREHGESHEEESEGDEASGEEDSQKDRRLVRLLIGSRILRHGRVRRTLLAHLLRERGEAEDEEEDGEDEFAEGGDEDRHLLRLLIGSRILRRRRARRMLLAHLLRDRDEAEGEEDEGEDEFAEGGDRERRLVRLLVGHRVRQRKHARRMLMAHLLREREEA